MIYLIFANGTDICICSDHSEVGSSQSYRLQRYGAQQWLAMILGPQTVLGKQTLIEMT